MIIQNSPKAFVRSDDEVLIVCPECSFSKSLDAEQFRHRKNLLKIKCKCGHTFTVQLEFRLHIRKETELEGICNFNSNGKGVWEVILVNLSLGGVCLELPGNKGISVGDKGTLEFTLDNRKETTIIKQIIVKSISASLVGCEFVEDRAYQKELGFYLQP